MFLSNIPVLSTSGDTGLASHILSYPQINMNGNMSAIFLASCCKRQITPVRTTLIHGVIIS